MFKRSLALAVAAAFLGFGPAAAAAKTHHHHKHHMMSSKSSMSSHSTRMHTKQCRDAKTGRFMKCSKM